MAEAHDDRRHRDARVRAVIDGITTALLREHAEPEEALEAALRTLVAVARDAGIGVDTLGELVRAEAMPVLTRAEASEEDEITAPSGGQSTP